MSNLSKRLSRWTHFREESFLLTIVEGIIESALIGVYLKDMSEMFNVRPKNRTIKITEYNEIKPTRELLHVTVKS